MTIKKGKKKLYVGWVHGTKIYSNWGDEYVATGTTIYKRKRCDTPYKIRATIERIK